MKKLFYLNCLTALALIGTGCNEEPTDTPDQPQTEMPDTTASAAPTHHHNEDKSQRVSPPAQATGNVNGVKVTVDYSQPSVKERKIWGNLVPYNQVWRTGANEATWIEFDQDVTVNGQALSEGKYALFTIPADHGPWTVIFNKVWEQWGANDYNESEDALRVTITPEQQQELTERMTFKVEDQVYFHWEHIMLSLDIQPANG